MDDNLPPPSNVSPPAARTAESLRELQARARAAMKSQRERMGRLEAQLTEQFDSIASALAEEAGSQSNEIQQAAQSLAEAERLRQELDAERAAWQAERDEAAADEASRKQQLDQRQSELDGQLNDFEAKSDQLAADRAALDSRQHALDERAAQLNTQERETRQRQEELAKRERQMSTGEQETAEVTRQFDEEREAWSDERAAWSAERTAWDTERTAIEEARSKLEHERDELANSLTQSTGEVAALRNGSARQQADFEQQLQEQRAAWDEARATMENERSAIAAKCDELAEALAASGQALAAARTEVEGTESSHELQQKFDLALEDVQRLRHRVAELEQELAARPAADDTESVELVHLRSERDALADQVAELEQRRSAPPADADTAQEIADLQRRFELAVEDVRDLKRANSQLEAKLVEAQSRPAAAAAAKTSAVGGSSWEVLKQQMLANLEGEVDDGDEERRDERTKIADTIRITDNVVANKDREIAELKARLAESNDHESAEAAAIRELVDADSIIQQHRDNIARLESEMNDKLRAAELELSVERAKIAREQSHLGNLRAEIESMRPGDANGAAGAQAPKRKWLSKLGLGNEDDG